MEVGKQCTKSVKSCHRVGSDQNNWLITPHISKVYRGLIGQVNVKIEFAIPCKNCRRLLEVHIWEKSCCSDSEASKTSHYTLTNLVKPFGSIIDKNTTMMITIYFKNSRENGFYLAIRDSSSCITIYRLRVYFYICPETTHDLVNFPFGIENSTTTASCAAGAVAKNNVAPLAICSEFGWSLLQPVCYCLPGFASISNGRTCRGKLQVSVLDQS